MPAVALIPVAILVLGFGYAMEISLVAFAALLAGADLRPCRDRQHRAAAARCQPRAAALGAFGRVTKIVLPATLPRYFVAFRLAAAVSLIIAVTVEIAANPLGIGYELMTASQSLHPDLMFAMVLWIGLVGWALNARAAVRPAPIVRPGRQWRRSRDERIARAVALDCGQHRGHRVAGRWLGS